MSVRIIGGNLRDLSYIAANLRPEDRAEVDCQLDGWTPATLAIQALHGFAYVAELDGNPEAAFGAGEVRSGLWIAWSWGTKRMRRCVPRITQFFYDVLGPDVASRGAHRVEARALADNDLAIRWLNRLGAHERCLLPAYGKNGEDFILFDWTRDTWANVSISKATGTEAAPSDADGSGQGRSGPRRRRAAAVECK
ncbi:hypothetical protein FJ959_22305 [Mesorhizobium sp. B2-2-4]|uniref:hypothetical protein n=1 Tax=unclassified Mesorhizobium TaxID=325217 RepID=UPI0011290A24|nr:MULTISPECIES: hypothetical protein [unclassified Mesorhizobium]TPM53264.1 hypothetical protein FJ959_22305 [Mesorhizobium sp. B2-2-4]TPM62093.1 hypothetical protein FJ965_21065 [Mesorhizobium sp. B2-2-1]TPN68464.1 hypothetical protein FJ984_11545 [Mesorhizobium sp. B1-1-3]